MVRLTGVIGVIGFVQLIVFGLQARRLKDTVEKMDEIATGQTADMQASIAEAGRAAKAMEDVAAGINANVETTRRMAENQREFWQQQMRAYVSLRYQGTIHQDDTTDYKFEVGMIIANTGHTPAHGVRYVAKLEVLPLPLPDDFAFDLPDIPVNSAGVLGPQQIFSVRTPIDRMLTNDEITAVKTGQEERLYIYGSVTYKDAFGELHYTNFSQRLEWLRDGVTANGFNTLNHNDAT
jgi:hypothetical protein